MAELLIDYRNVEITRQDLTILKNTNLRINKGEFIYLIGRVGSGKSSLMKSMYADIPISKGEAEIFNYNLKKIKRKHIPHLRRKIGIVFQDFQLLTDRTVYANLEFVLKATGWNRKDDIEERIETVLKRVDMHTKGYKMPHQLSGGEQQRIVIARALLNNPAIILADEPTGNLDPETGVNIVNILRDICNSGTTVIMATHNHALTKEYPGRVLCIEGNDLIELNAENETDSGNITEGLTAQKSKEEIDSAVVLTDEMNNVHSNETETVSEESDKNEINDTVSDEKENFINEPNFGNGNPVNEGLTLNDLYASRNTKISVSESLSEDIINDMPKEEVPEEKSPTEAIAEPDTDLPEENGINNSSPEITETSENNINDILEDTDTIEIGIEKEVSEPLISAVEDEDSDFILVDEDFGFSEIDTEIVINDLVGETKPKNQ